MMTLCRRHDWRGETQLLTVIVKYTISVKTPAMISCREAGTKESASRLRRSFLCESAWSTAMHHNGAFCSQLSQSAKTGIKESKFGAKFQWVAREPAVLGVGNKKIRSGGTYSPISHLRYDRVTIFRIARWDYVQFYTFKVFC